MTTLTRFNLALLLILLVALLGRAWLIQTESVKLNSDEAVVGLMARHITQGKPIPTFYYGQAYMGSLDAVLIAGGFLTLGESLTAIRLVQAVFYLLSVWTAYLLAYEITHRRRVALVTTLLLAIPTMLGTLYTTLTLGGYNEIILFGNLILLLGWRVTNGRSEKAWHWGLLGLAMGLGWWTNGAIITPIGVVGIIGLRDFSLRRWRLYLLAGAAFLTGSAPWWLYNLNHQWEALKFLSAQNVPPGVEPLTILEKLVAFFIVGLSGVYGFRFPWGIKFQTGLLAAAAGVVYLLLITRMVAGFYARARRQPPPLSNNTEAMRWVWLAFGMIALIFMLSPFQDATGRYLMPFWVPATIGIALGLVSLPRYAGATALGVLLAFQFSTTLLAARSETGIEAQLKQDLRIDARYDGELLAFLDAHDYHYGYTSYWVSYRLMFVSGEKVIFDTSLPYDEYGYRSHNNRYLPYTKMVAQADRVVWITHNFPELDRVINTILRRNGVAFQTQTIGPFRVYYDFSRRVAPADFGLNSPLPLDQFLAGVN